MLFTMGVQMMLCSFVIPVFNGVMNQLNMRLFLLMMALVMIRLKSYINYMIMTTMFTLSHSEKILENQQHSKLDSEMSVVV